MAEDPDLSARLGALEEQNQNMNDTLQDILDRLTKLESKKGTANGGASKKKGASTDKSKALKPSVAAKKGGSSKKKGSTGDLAKKKKGGTAAASGGKKKKGDAGGSSSSSSGGRAKIPDERKVSYRFGKAVINVARPSEGYPTEEEQAEIPDEELSIEWIHGFAGNGDDGAKAVKASPDGSKLIYFIACFGVVYDVETGEQQYFRKHSDDITCIALNPNSTLVATGQKDPKDEPGQGKALPNIYVWDYETMKPVAFLDAVCERKVSRVGWSGKTGMLYSIAGDDEQSLKCYDPETFNMKGNAKPIMEFSTYKQKIFGFECNPTPEDGVYDELLCFGMRQFTRIMLSGEEGSFELKKKSPSIATFKSDGEDAFTDAIFLSDGRYAVAAKTGSVYIGRGDNVMSAIKCHEKAVGCIVELSGNRLVTAGHDQFVKTWDILGEDEKCQLKEQEGGCVVTVDDSDFVMRPKAMARRGESDSVLIGSKSNQIVEYCTSAGGADGDDEKAEQGKAKMLVDGHDGQIWGLACHPNEPLFCTGGHDNAIKIWDAPSHRCIQTLEFPIQDGKKKGKKIEQVAWSDDGELIVVGTLDSNIGCVAYPSLEFLGWTNIPPKSKSADVEQIGYLRLSPDNKRLAVGHYDSNLYVFEIKKGEDEVLKPWKKAMDVGAAVTHCRWSEDSTQIQTLTRDYSIGLFKLDLKKKKGERDPYLTDPDIVKWAGDPLIAGWDVEGLYQSQEGWDGTDLNDASVDPSGKLIVSGDDYGNVRLHNYPAIKPEACKKYPGHAEFVVGIEFLSAHPQVISCGGADMCVVQWSVTGGDA